MYVCTFCRDHTSVDSNAHSNKSSATSSNVILNCKAPTAQWWLYYTYVCIQFSNNFSYFFDFPILYSVFVYSTIKST